MAFFRRNFNREYVGAENKHDLNNKFKTVAEFLPSDMEKDPE
jgi:hypothetical protein